MGSLADNTSGGHYGYRMSKAALNMGVVSLARDLSASKMSVGLFHPGYVRTGMTGGNGHISAAESATGLIEQINALGPGSDICLRHANGEMIPW